MKEWVRDRYGTGKSVDIAEGRGKIRVFRPVYSAGQKGRYRGTFVLETASNEMGTPSEGEVAILVIAERRLQQALDDVRALLDRIENEEVA